MAPTRPLVCYLDYDGVLHPDAVHLGPKKTPFTTMGSLFQWAPILEEALLPYPTVRIVLSTAWVRVLGFNTARAALTPMLRERVIGATFHRREHARTKSLEYGWLALGRGAQIQLDVNRRGVPRWFAIDDAADEFTAEQAQRLISCRRDLGLSEEATLHNLRSILASHD